jgi:hypothetical protein
MLRHRPAAKICPRYSMGTNSIPMASERLRSSNGGRSAGRGTAPTSEDFGAEQGRAEEGTGRCQLSVPKAGFGPSKSVNYH